MMGLATGRYDVQRGTSENEYGDEVDEPTTIQTSVLGSVIERSRSDYDPASGRVSTIRYLVGRFNSGADIRDGDRLKDSKTGETFIVTTVQRPTNLIHKADLVLDLTRI